MKILNRFCARVGIVNISTVILKRRGYSGESLVTFQLTKRGDSWTDILCRHFWIHTRKDSYGLRIDYRKDGWPNSVYCEKTRKYIYI